MVKHHSGVAIVSQVGGQNFIYEFDEAVSRDQIIHSFEFSYFNIPNVEGLAIHLSKISKRQSQNRLIKRQTSELILRLLFC